MNRNQRYILKDKKVIPVDLMEWAEFLSHQIESLQKQQLKTLSTVFLGLDHRFTGDGPPLVFETMVLGGKLDQEQERYSAWDEAVKGHNKMVQRVQGANT